MATRIALALLCALTTSFTPPTPRRTEVKLRKTRGAGGDLVDPDAGAPDDDAMTELRESDDAGGTQTKKTNDKGRQGQPACRRSTSSCSRRSILRN